MWRLSEKVSYFFFSFASYHIANNLINIFFMCVLVEDAKTLFRVLYEGRIEKLFKIAQFNFHNFMCIS